MSNADNRVKELEEKRQRLVKFLQAINAKGDAYRKEIGVIDTELNQLYPHVKRRTPKGAGN